MRFNYSKADIERFWSSFERGKDDECWPWLKAVTYNRAVFALNGKNISAQQMMYEVTFGVWHGNQLILCRITPGCMNTNHFRPAKPSISKDPLKLTVCSCGQTKDRLAATCRRCYVPTEGLKNLKGPSHPAWKGGIRVDKDGYLKRYDPNHPWPRKGGYIRENIRVMELSIGRRLEQTEVVHHRDGDRQNNNLSNLEIMGWSEHSKLHHPPNMATKICNTCGTEFVRKRFKNGHLESSTIFKNRKFCSRWCSSNRRKDF